MSTLRIVLAVSLARDGLHGRDNAVSQMHPLLLRLFVNVNPVQATSSAPHGAQYRKIRIVADASNGPIFGGPNDLSTASSNTV
ncbi:hypothetical protein BLA9940_01036 [Burkholderia aenigmatica]|nr:hypothetical protein BLA9940_01036 [Burkholderia aenigmatica]